MTRISRQVKVTYDEEDNVNTDGKDPVEHGDKKGKNGSEEKETHGVSVLLSWVIESVLSSVSVNLLRSETEQGGSDTEHQSPEDELLSALTFLLKKSGLT
jgi:hypothetical protein